MSRLKRGAVEPAEPQGVASKMKKEETVVVETGPVQYESMEEDQGMYY